MTSPAFEIGIRQGLAMGRELTFRESDPTAAVVEAAKGSGYENDVVGALNIVDAWRTNAGELAKVMQGIASASTSQVVELSIKQATVDAEIDLLVTNITESLQLLSEARTNEEYSRTELAEAEISRAAFIEQRDLFFETLAARINDCRTDEQPANVNSKLRSIGIVIDDMTLIDETGESSFTKKMNLVVEAQQDYAIKKAQHDHDVQQLQLAEESYALAVSMLSEKERELAIEGGVFARRAKKIGRHALLNTERTPLRARINALRQLRGDA